MGEDSMSIRILLIDDHSVVRTGLRAVLEAEHDFEVVGEADSGTRAIALSHKLRPDVVVADLLLPDMDGVTVTQRIRAELPETQVVILTSVSDEDQWIVRAIRAGALSYVMKNGEIAEVVEAVRQAAAGTVRLSSRAAARLVRELQSPAHPVPLTDREREVLREIAIGRTNKEIARSLDIALTTVKSHVRTILDKLGMESRTQAALHAVRYHILSEEDLPAA
jgi:DNA-binding NarL/FixJ family response regulator